MVDVRSLDGVLSLIPAEWDFCIERVDGQHWASFGLPDGTRTPAVAGDSPAAATVAALLAEGSEWFAVFRQSGGQIAHVMLEAPEPTMSQQGAFQELETVQRAAIRDAFSPRRSGNLIDCAARERDEKHPAQNAIDEIEKLRSAHARRAGKTDFQAGVEQGLTDALNLIACAFSEVLWPADVAEKLGVRL